jgi:hypothetical protein
VRAEAYVRCRTDDCKRDISVKIERLPIGPDQAEAEKLHSFAARANSILAFVECSDQLRPKLREAIVEAMLWAQTQP